MAEEPVTLVLWMGKLIKGMTREDLVVALTRCVVLHRKMVESDAGFTRLRAREKVEARRLAELEADGVQT